MTLTELLTGVGVLVGATVAWRVVRQPRTPHDASFALARTVEKLTIGVAIVGFCQLSASHVWVQSRQDSALDATSEVLRKLIVAGNIDRAVKVCSATDSAATRVVQAALVKVNRADAEIDAAAGEAKLQLLYDLGRTTPWLPYGLFVLLAGCASVAARFGTGADDGRVVPPGAGKRLALFLCLAALLFAFESTLARQSQALIREVDLTRARVLNLIIANRQKVDLQGLDGDASRPVEVPQLAPVYSQ